MIIHPVRKWATVATIFAVVIALGAPAFARMFSTNENSGTVHFQSAVQVGSTQLPAGDYKVTWTGSTDNAQVTFKQYQTTATARAKVVEIHRNVDSYATKTEKGTRVLTEVQFRKITLVLNEAPGESTGE